MSRRIHPAFAVAGAIFVVAWTIPFWLILSSFLIPGLSGLDQDAQLDGAAPGPLDEDPATPAAHA